MAENKKKNQAPASKHTKTQAKPKKKKQYTPFLKFICFLVIGASAYLLLEVFKEVYTTINLKKQLAEVQDKYQQVQDENSYLTTENWKIRIMSQAMPEELICLPKTMSRCSICRKAAATDHGKRGTSFFCSSGNNEGKKRWQNSRNRNYHRFHMQTKIR